MREHAIFVNGSRWGDFVRKSWCSRDLLHRCAIMNRGHILQQRENPILCGFWTRPRVHNRPAMFHCWERIEFSPIS